MNVVNALKNPHQALLILIFPFIHSPNRWSKLKGMEQAGRPIGLLGHAVYRTWKTHYWKLFTDDIWQKCHLYIKDNALIHAGNKGSHHEPRWKTGTEFAQSVLPPGSLCGALLFFCSDLLFPMSSRCVCSLTSIHADLQMGGLQSPSWRGAKQHRVPRTAYTPSCDCSTVS